MKQSKPNQRGFTAVEVVIVIVVLVVIGAVGWLVYSKNHKKTTPESSSTSSSQQTASTSKLKTATKPAQPAKPANPYAGWKTFCSSAGGLCLKYPSDWKLTRNTQYYEIDTITSPSGNVAVTYKPAGSPGGTGSNATVSVVSVNSAASADFKAVSLIQHYVDSSNALDYAADLFVVPSGYTDHGHAYVAGATYSNSYEAQIHVFVDNKLNKYGQVLKVYQPKSNPDLNLFNSSSAARAWLNSPDVKTATKILESVDYNK